MNMSKYPGQFIVLEGPDACGKTTTLNELKKTLPKDKVVYTREPGGTKLAEEIRKLILHNDAEVMALETQIYLFAAARKQHMHEVIIPALKAGKTVICDRFLLSTIVYQAGLDEEQSQVEMINRIIKVLELNKPALWDDESQEYILPDRTIYFDITPETMETRMMQRGMEDDKDLALAEFDAKVSLLNHYLISIRLLKGSGLENYICQEDSYLSSQSRETIWTSYEGWETFAHNIDILDANKGVEARVKAITHLIGYLG